MDNVLMEYYLSDDNNLAAAMADTGLAADEIEFLVGRFASHSQRAGQLRGKVVVKLENEGVVAEIRDSFNKSKVYFRTHENG